MNKYDFRPPIEIKEKLFKFFRFITILLSVGVFFNLEARALEMEFNSDGLLLSGRIQVGDAEKILLLQTNNNVSKYILNSIGGDVNEALKIAAIVKTYRISTEVEYGKRCASSCALIFFAGFGRNAIAPVAGIDYARYPGIVGLHRPYYDENSTRQLNASEAVKRQKDAILKMVKYLEDELLPREIIDLMMSRSSKDIYWMNFDDLKQIGYFNPADQELVIARCGWQADLKMQYVKARDRGDESERRRILEELEWEELCIGRLRPNWEQAMDLKKRVRKGWRPWNGSSGG